MARRKGKSRQRIRDWRQAISSDSMADRAGPKGRFAPREVKLPACRLQAPEGNLEELPKAEGMVAGFFPGGATVRIAGEEALCAIAKTFRAPEGLSPLAVGDAVTVALASERHVSDAAAGDKVRADGMILARQPRSSALVRPQPRSGKRTDRYDARTEKVIVANMDQLLIVASTCQPALREALIDRFLIVAERSELAPLLVINKVDLGSPDQAVTAGFVELGVHIVQCSAVTGEGLEDLRAALAGRRSVLAGASGTGKSTLVNAIIPGAAAATRPVRRSDERGRHTTAAAVIYDLPPAGPGQPAGGMIVDTPGVRELGMELTAAELPWYFPEFEQLAGRCQFRNCTHTHEPDCAVIAAVQAGDIQPRRYDSYLRILDSLPRG